MGSCHKHIELSEKRCKVLFSGVPTTISANGFGWVSADWVLVENAANVPVVEAPAPPLTSVTPVPPAAAQCALISQSPADYSVLKPDTDFDMVWTLRNTSSMTWDKSQVDVRYRGALNGVRIHQGPDVYDLNETVKPGQEYRVVLDAFSPSKPGQYAEGWELVQGSKSLCTFYLVIEVK